jgi:hypothetical protein
MNMKNRPFGGGFHPLGLLLDFLEDNAGACVLIELLEFELTLYFLLVLAGVNDEA